MWIFLLFVASVSAYPQWNIPGIPGHPSNPHIPGVPEFPKVPQIPGIPKVPQIPGVPNLPQVPGFPGMNFHEPAFPEDVRGSSSVSRIVNGWPAKLGQFPYQARSRAKKGAHSYSICGGSILSETVVLTACHCTVGHDSFDMGFGSIDMKDPAIEMTVTKTIQHEDFNPKTLNNDIALFILPEKLSFTDNIKPIQLPSYSQKDTTFVGKKATVSGHGKTGDHESVSTKLMYVYQKVIGNEECRKHFGRRLIKASTLCVVGWDNKNQATCQGDSGGPLVVDDDDLGEVIQIGVVSFNSKKGCEAQIPTAFARVSHYLDWINKNGDISIRD